MLVSFALGDVKVPNANAFASQWNIGFIVVSYRNGIMIGSNHTTITHLGSLDDELCIIQSFPQFALKANGSQTGAKSDNLLRVLETDNIFTYFYF